MSDLLLFIILKIAKKSLVLGTKKNAHLTNAGMCIFLLKILFKKTIPFLIEFNFTLTLNL